MTVDEFAATIKDREARIEYAMTAFEHCRGISARAVNRACWLASKVLAVEYPAAVAIIRLRALGRHSDLERYIGDLQPHVMGHVYFAQSPARPGLFKVGFSHDPEKRAKAIGRHIGAPVTIRETIPGTMLDEHTVHCFWKDRHEFGEWFRGGRD